MIRESLNFSDGHNAGIWEVQDPQDAVDREIETQAFNFVSLVPAKHLINGLPLNMCCLYVRGRLGSPNWVLLEYGAKQISMPTMVISAMNEGGWGER